MVGDVLPLEVIENKIYFVRGKKIMLDRDLAQLYGVSTSRLNEQVKRNPLRFPEDFMFQLTKDEFADWISQIAMSINLKKGLRRCPYAFTENGVAMLSSVLSSPQAIMVNIQIMRAFTKLRELAGLHADIVRRINKHDVHLLKHDRQFMEILEAIEKLTASPSGQSKRKIGFIP